MAERRRRREKKTEADASISLALAIRLPLFGSQKLLHSQYPNVERSG
jgi:hypothetical protein